MPFSSLRSQLLFWLLAPLALVAVIDAWVTYRIAGETATIVQQRMLLGAARVIGEQVHLEEGVVQVMIPPAALELFASPSRDRVFYRVSGEEGRLLSGYYDLAMPAQRPGVEEAVFFDTVQRDRPVHAVAFAQPLMGAPQLGPILIEVAQTLEGRDQLAREIWGIAVTRHFALLLLVGLFLWFGLRRSIRPLLDLCDRIGRRSPGSHDRLELRAVPSELQPLVAAVNEYAARMDLHMSAHSRFIADASHQLRTPLTLISTQVAYALRQPEGSGRDDTLRAIHHSVQHGVRVVQQLLAFATAEAATGQAQDSRLVDMAETVRSALESLALLAVQRGIDLGFEQAGLPAIVACSPHSLLQLVSNLLDNALRYTPQGGTVTACVSATASEVMLSVVDNGPGIPVDQREKVFERFYRLNDVQSDGCGLGLAIVREIARACGAVVALEQAPGGRGLRVAVSFPVPR